MGIGAPVMILTAVPGDIARMPAWPAPISPTTGRWIGDSSVAPDDVGEPDGVPVHAGVVEGRQVDRGDDLLGGGQVERLEERLGEVLQRLDVVEDAVQELVDGGDAVTHP